MTSTSVGTSIRPAVSFCLCCFWQVVRHLRSLQVSGFCHHTDLHPDKNVYLTNWFILSGCFFDRREDVCGPYMCLGSAVTWRSTPVGTSTQPAGSFCLYWFWQAMRCLWSLYMSGIPHHTDLHPSSNVFLTSWFILAVLFLTGGETSVVLHISRIPCYMHLHPCRNVYLTSWFILSVLFLTGGETSVVPTSVWDPPSHIPPPQ